METTVFMKGELVTGKIKGHDLRVNINLMHFPIDLFKADYLMLYRHIKENALLKAH
jgi:uncharacterized protein involved in propanediol utilization